VTAPRRQGGRPAPRGWRTAGRALAAVLALLGGTALMLAFLQKKMIYHPTRELEITPGRIGLAHEDVFLKTADGVTIHGWYVPAPGAVASLLFLHGNAGNISHRLDNVVRLHRLGVTVLIIDYRGYGLSEGTPGEQGLYEDARAAYAVLRERSGETPERTAVFGRSLGGAVAVDLCSREACPKLILESTFTSTADMVRDIFPLLPPGPWITERFDSESKIRKIRAPLLQFHGTRDTVVPYRLGEKLFRAAPGPKRFVPIPGAGHNDTCERGGAEYFETIRAFLEE